MEGCTINTIKDFVNHIVDKHQTTDPYKICQAEGIICKDYVMHEDLLGVYQAIDGIKLIFINAKLSKEEKISSCAHELAHALLHEEYNCYLNSDTSEFIQEKEADFFSNCLINLL